MPPLKELRQRARRLRAETYALYLAARDPRTPWYIRLLVAGIVAYAFSPVDLIPDFIPVIGYLDDLLLLPLGIALAVKLIPRAILDDCRKRAQEFLQTGKPVSRAAGAVIIALWLMLGAFFVVWGFRAFLGGN
jgi:uncharacterized membrane protein YkvA (DUF1232 family)